jgi:hypothetical protein
MDLETLEICGDLCSKTIPKHYIAPSSIVYDDDKEEVDPGVRED